MLKTDAIAEPTQTTPRLGSNLTSRAHPPLWWALLQLMSLGFHVPLALLTGSQRAITSSWSVALIGLAVSVASILVYLVFAQLIDTWTSLGGVSAAVLLFWQLSSLSDLGDVPVWIIQLAFSILIIAAAVRFAPYHFFRLVAFIASLAMGATLALLAVSNALSTPAAVVEVRDPMGDVTLDETPDITFLLFDGYARGDVLERLFDYDNSAFLSSLESSGFDVAERSTTNYTITHLSLPAILEMSYMNEPNDYMHNSDLIALARSASGENTLVRLLKEEGYKYIHGDTADWFNTCGPEVDLCQRGPFLDVTGYALLSSTPIGGILYPESGDPTTALNRIRIDQLNNWDAGERSSDQQPTFTFLHLVLPHPPLFLDAECEVRIEGDLSGRILNDGRISQERLAARKAAWVRQTQCANLTILNFLEQADPDDVVVLLSDHGPDSRFIIESPSASVLTDAQLAERIPNLTAVRLPESCRGSLPDDVQSVNVFRVVLSCLSDDPIDLLEPHYFAATFGGSIVELKYSDPLDD